MQKVIRLMWKKRRRKTKLDTQRKHAAADGSERATKLVWNDGSRSLILVVVVVVSARRRVADI